MIASNLMRGTNTEILPVAALSRKWLHRWWEKTER